MFSLLTEWERQTKNAMTKAAATTMQGEGRFMGAIPSDPSRQRTVGIRGHEDICQWKYY
jgi:hypothetical protein